MKKELENGRKLEEETDVYSLDCLLHPKNHAAVIAKNNCTDWISDISPLNSKRPFWMSEEPNSL